MTLTLTPELEADIQEQLATGRFHSPVEVLETAMGVLRNSTPVEDLEVFNARLQEALDELDRGESYSPEEARAYIAAERAKL